MTYGWGIEKEWR